MGSDLRFSPWDVRSLYELQVYDCPECIFQDWSKQSFVNHATNSHPESIHYLRKIQDDSIDDVDAPWLNQENVKESYSEDQVRISYNDVGPANCNFCNQPFENNNKLISHILEQHSFGLIKCASCSEKFSDIITLEVHFKSSHSQDMLANEVILVKVEDENIIIKSDSNELHPFEEESEEVEQNTLIVKDESNAVLENSKLYKCQKCDRYYSSEETLQNHIITVHREKLVQKSEVECIETFDSENMNSQEEKSNSDDYNAGKLKKESWTWRKVGTLCKMCQTECFEPLQLVAHVLKTHSTTCSYCFKSFDKVLHLIEHIDEVHDNVVYACLSCEKIFLRSNEKREHMKNCDEKFKCWVCSKPFARINTLRNHIKGIHRKTRPEDTCHLCGKSYFGKLKLKNHIEIVHDKVNHAIPCDRCGKTFRHEEHLKAHILTTHEKRHKKLGIRHCDQCEKTYETRVGLKLHIRRVHLGEEKKFQCDFCGKEFYDQGHLNKHIKIVHEKVKDLKCSKCEKAFGTKQSLEFHFESQHAKKNFVCDICTLSLGSKAALKFHKESVHEKKPKNTCEECGKTFVYPYNYREHVKVVHKGIRDFKCDICGMEFVRNSYLQKHLSEQHPNPVVNG